MVFFMVPGLGECSYLIPRMIKSHVFQLSSTLACLGVRMPVRPFKHWEDPFPYPEFISVSLIWAVFASNAVVIFQWFFWGYSLAFSPSATNGYIGNLRNIGLMKVFGEPSPGSPLIPSILYSFFQMEFGCVTAGILMGGIAERGRVLPAMVFIFCWMTLVYCPLACWAWGVNGWAFKWGVLDFAGEFIVIKF